MAKIAYTKLALKKQDKVINVEWGENTIEVKSYLPIQEKLNLIARVLNNTYDDNNFMNPVKIEVYSTMEMIYAYTNITFTDKQKEDIDKLFDVLTESGLASAILQAIPAEEYEFLMNGISDTVSSVYTYKNSALGILESISQDYKNADFDATEIQKKLADPENLELVKGILSKLG